MKIQMIINSIQPYLCCITFPLSNALEDILLGSKGAEAGAPSSTETIETRIVLVHIVKVSREWTLGYHDLISRACHAFAVNPREGGSITETVEPRQQNVEPPRTI